MNTRKKVKETWQISFNVTTVDNIQKYKISAKTYKDDKIQKLLSKTLVCYNTYIPQHHKSVNKYSQVKSEVPSVNRMTKDKIKPHVHKICLGIFFIEQFTLKHSFEK